MIRYAEKRETEEIKRLFNVCFPGEESFCSWFFESCYKAENTLVDTENGVLRGSAMELPFKIRGIGEVTYLYAVGTFPEFRGRGISRNIIEQSHENDKLKGRAASILIPGKPSLFDFYRPLGYRENAFIKERTYFVTEEKKDLTLGKCKADELLKVYNKSLLEKQHIMRNREYFEKQLQMFKVFGGGCLGLYDKTEIISYCFYSFENEKLFFDEIMGNKKEVLAGKILKKFDFKKALAREPGKTKPLGMTFFYGEPFEFYMNLMYN